ncbi:MAG: hypothetical protein Q7K55_04945 [Candidatus Levybacteria bacterium]|nr:hypothetical protein [Candidatus Levybacteria bacterium]
MLEKLEISKQPEKIPDQELGNLVASIGNNEAKALTLLAMRTGIVYGQGDLNSALIELQGNSPGWRMHKNNPFDYCRNSFSPIGLVTKEIKNHDVSEFGYIITRYGQDIGAPLAGLLLDFSLKHPDFALHDFFSDTQMGGADPTNSQRSPLTRMQILWELATAGNKIRIIDLAESLGDKARQTTVGRHLKEMAKRGIISCESRGTTDEPITLYHLNDNQPDSLLVLDKYYPVMTRRLYEAMRSDPEKLWTREAIVDTMIQKYPELRGSKKSLQNNITSVLKTLRDTEIIHFEKFHARLQSEAYLTPEQREVVAELLEILDGVQYKKPEALRKGRELANLFLNNHPREVASLMQKAKEHSPQANANRAEMLDAVMQIVIEQPFITAPKVKKILEESGKEVALSTAQDYLSTLAKDEMGEKQIGSEKRKGVNYWYPLSLVSPQVSIYK